MIRLARIPSLICLSAAICGVLSACGGGGSKAQPATPTVSIGATVSGLKGALVLQNNAASLDVSTNGSIPIGRGGASGSAYAVGVATQPALQPCVGAKGAGTATGNVSNVTVTCSDKA